MAVEEKEDFTSEIEPPTRGMIDIADKPALHRTALATGTITLSTRSIWHITNKSNPKGDVLENAKLAAIHAVKQTPFLVFMCHPIQITSIKVDFEIKDLQIKIIVTVKASDRTGVEIEAMAGVMNGLLAIFDLCKRYEKDEHGRYPAAKISDIYVLDKTKESIE